MRILLAVILLCLSLSFPACTKASIQELKSISLTLSSLKLDPKTYKNATAIAKQFKHSIYRMKLIEIMIFQLLSLSMVISLFYLNTN